jgi:hypothetical protein
MLHGIDAYHHAFTIWWQVDIGKITEIAVLSER